MVKGVSRQVIVVHSPDPKLFEQAIFILRENAVEKGVTDEALLREAKQLLRHNVGGKKRGARLQGIVWACGGAVVTGLAWLLTVIL